ncbi:MAG: endonuclease [Thermoanaerobaculales bacterium]|nr:endonuclease [Thermoanaerobaculales bacterium]
MKSFSIFSCLVFALVVAPVVDAQVINEWVANHTGADPDNYEYLEIFGSPSTDYSSLTILHIEGDTSTSTGTIGRIDRFYNVGTTDSSGFWYTGFLSAELENGSMTLLLVDVFTGAIGDDVDSDNDGTIDNVLWSSVIDGVSTSDGDAGDAYYSSVILSSSMDSSYFQPGGASRIPNGTDTDTLGDWRRNDFFGAGLPGFYGAVGHEEAYNTPNTVNRIPVPVLNEIVFDHVGSDDHEFIEVYGPAQGDYSAYHVLVVEGDTEDDMGNIDLVYEVGVMGGGSSWSTGFKAGVMEDGSTTFLLVEGFTGTVGADLDANDDGVLDGSPPWTVVADDLAFLDGDPGDAAYSTIVLQSAFDGITGMPGGASRIPSGFDSDAITDWYRNDFDGEGMDGFSGVITSGEAYNTPALANRIGLYDYYKNVDTSSAAALRASLHDIIDDHIRHEYTSDATDTWDILDPASENPNYSSDILDVYKNASYPKAGEGNAYYNREHTWPKSYGFPGEETVPYTDCQQLFLADSAYNTDRSNHPYRYCVGCTEKPTVFNNGTGGDPGTGYPGYSNWDTGSFSTGTWETWIGRQGDVARAVLYMDVRYEGDTNGVTDLAELDLVLTDNAALILTTNQSPAYMGILADILAWHAADPPDDLELHRVDIVWKHQGNRNPFIDHPEWVECIFSGVCGSIFSDDFESGGLTAWSSVTSP